MRGVISKFEAGREAINPMLVPKVAGVESVPAATQSSKSCGRPGREWRIVAAHREADARSSFTAPGEAETDEALA